MNSIQKLGILVVYFVDVNDELILDMHLNMIDRNTSINYTIYAATNRLPPIFQAKLEQRAHIKFCPIPATDLRISKEHAYYLEALADIAVSDGASHLCTLDVDSFPISPQWAEQLASNLSIRSPVTAILREENGDSVLVHPSCTFFDSNFWTTYRPRLLPSWRECTTWRCRLFLLRHMREADTGIGISYILHKHGLSWKRMLRTNKVNDHAIMGGIYDGLIFHLGASSRSKKHFRTDMDRIHLSFTDRVALEVGRYVPFSSLKTLVTRRARANLDNLLAPIHDANHSSYKQIRSALLADPEAYFSYLSGNF